MTTKWLQIGLFLGISFGELQKLKASADDDKVLGLVDIWTRWNYDTDTFGKPSWKNLVHAIGARAGGNACRAANKIADEHKPASKMTVTVIM